MLCVFSVVLAVGVFAGCTKQSPRGFSLAGIRFGGPSPSDYARQAFDLSDADKRREGINKIASASWGGEQPYLRMYRLLLHDPDDTVRAACLYALGRHGTVEDVQAIMANLTHDSPAVRCQAAWALQKIHNPQAIAPLIKSLKDSNSDVRLAGAVALGQYATPAVFDALVGALSDDDFAVVDAAARSLLLLTGQDIGTDPAKWLAWATNYPGDHPRQLFDAQQPYQWQPYQSPRRFWQKLSFWKRPQAVSPQTPTGLDADSAKKSQ